MKLLSIFLYKKHVSNDFSYINNTKIFLEQETTLYFIYKIFDYITYIKVINCIKSKLDVKNKKCVFLDYYEGMKIYKFMHLDNIKIMKNYDIKYLNYKNIFEYLEIFLRRTKNIFVNIFLKNKRKK